MRHTITVTFDVVTNDQMELDSLVYGWQWFSSDPRVDSETVYIESVEAIEEGEKEWVYDIDDES